MNRRMFLAVTTAGAASGCLSGLGGGQFAGSIQYEIRDLNATVEKLFPTHDYHFTHESYIHELDDDVKVEKEPIDYDDLDPELQEAVRRIVEENAPTGFDDPPNGLLETVDQHIISCPWWCSYSNDYVELHYVETDPAAPPLAELAAEVADERTGIHLTLTNPSDQSLSASSNEAPPFGVLKAVGIGETEHRFPLWSDYYEEVGHIRIRDGRLVYPDDLHSLEVAGETEITRTYELSSRLADEFVAGEYTLSPRSDGSEYLFGEQVDVPFVMPINSPARPAGEFIAFLVEFDLVEQ